MLYLVIGEVRKKQYMQDDAEIKTITRLVEAHDWISAERKFSDHYESKTVNYDIYYSVRNLNSTEIII